jgi:biotin carboxylase
MKLPIIVKPTDRSGSRGIFKLTGFEGLQECVKKACESSFEKCAIVEEYIEGNEYSCECISQNGKHYFLAVTKKYTTGAPHFIEIGHVEPSGLEIEKVEQVKEHVFRALDALHVSCGASHSEFKVTPEGDIRLIEIGARMGGDCIGSDLVYLSTGYDFVKMTVQTALGEPIDIIPAPHTSIAAVRYIMDEKDYEHYLSVQEKNADIIVRVSDINMKGAETVTDSSTRHGFYIAAGADACDICNLLQLCPTI